MNKSSKMAFTSQAREDTRLSKVMAFLYEQNVRSYIVGGYVRDILLGRGSQDVDIAVIGDAPDVARKLANNLGGSYVLLDEKNRIARVVFSTEGVDANTHWHCDFSTITESIETDLARRDFTIDAMAIEVRKDQTLLASDIFDPFGGLVGGNK